MGGTVNMRGKVLYTVIHLYNSCTQYSTVFVLYCPLHCNPLISKEGVGLYYQKKKSLSEARVKPWIRAQSSASIAEQLPNQTE